jgi:formylmethanofuran dehydrogenase subunit E
MESFEKLLEESTRLHGHICPGQVLGVRMSMLGLQCIAIDDPKGKDKKKLYVIVEIDRCATDAIQSVTGCSLGKRSLRWLDFGIMAATFVNTDSGEAVRVTALEESRELSRNYCNNLTDKYARQLEAYKLMPDDELFRVERVTVQIPTSNMPGKPLRRVQCETCGDWIQDSRDVKKDGKALCRNCSGDRYYTVLHVDGVAETQKSLQQGS